EMPGYSREEAATISIVYDFSRRLEEAQENDSVSGGLGRVQSWLSGYAEEDLTTNRVGIEIAVRAYRRALEAQGGTGEVSLGEHQELVRDVAEEVLRSLAPVEEADGSWIGELSRALSES